MMERLGNPFICGGPVPPSHFIGREREVQIIFDQITSHALGSIAICGDRRIGKTSLLQYVCYPEILHKWGLPQDKYLFLFLDSQSISEFTPSRFWRRLLTLLLREKKGNLPPEMIEGILAKKEIGHTDFEIVLDEISRRGQVLALLLDEFEWVIKTDSENEPVTRHFLSGLRALMNRTPKALVLVVATCRELHELCHPIEFIGSPFDNEFTFRRLRPFTRREIDQLFDNALEGTGIEFTTEERDYICSLAGTHPFLIQLAGSTLLEFRMQGLETAPNSELIRTEFEELARYHLSQIWENCSREEQMLLTVLALKRLGEREESKWTYDGAAFERIFNRRERTLVDLLKRGLIAQVKKTIAVCPVTFELWVLREIRSADEEEFAKRETLMFDLLPRDEAEQVTNVMRLISEREDVRLGRTDWKRIGRYEIIEELGQGAMSIVYKARDPNIGRVVTLKVMQLEWETLSKKRFRNEAMSAGKLTHPNIVAVYDADEYRGQPFIVMEYLEGPTLAKVLKTLAPLPLERAVDIALQIGDALDYAHQRGVIHRDVKPSNIILLESGQVKVTDFGLGELALLSLSRASTGVRDGIFDYASPEQILGQEIDGRSDIFSLGVIVYEMLTGERPFRGKNVTAVIQDISSEEPLPLTALGPHLPSELKDILSKAMAKDANERYQTCAELVQYLRRVQLGVKPTKTEMPGDVTAPPVWLSRLSKSSRQTLGLAEAVRQRLGHDLLATEHLLWGLYQLSNGLAREILTTFASHEQITVALKTLIRAPDEVADLAPVPEAALRQIAMTSNCQRAIGEAAQSVGEAHLIQEQHVLAGLLAVPESRGARWMAEMLDLTASQLYEIVTVGGEDRESLVERLRHARQAQVELMERRPAEFAPCFLSLSCPSPIMEVGQVVRAAIRLSRHSHAENEIIIPKPGAQIFVQIGADGLALQSERIQAFVLPEVTTEELRRDIECVALRHGHFRLTAAVSGAGAEPDKSTDVTISVRRSKSQELPELPSPLGPHPGRQPDLTMRVYVTPLDEAGLRYRLSYVAFSPLSRLRLPGVPIGSVNVSAAQLAQIRVQLALIASTMSSASPASIQARLSALGKWLYRTLYPKKARKLYREMVATDIQSWLILREAEPWIPWELVKPFDATGEDDFWGAQFAITRFIEGLGTPLQYEFPLGRVSLTLDERLRQQYQPSEWQDLFTPGVGLRLRSRLMREGVEGYISAMQYVSPVWGLHFEGVPDSLAQGTRTLMVQDTQEMLSEEVVQKATLDFWSKRPLVTFGMVTLDGQSALTDMERQWVPTFIKAGVGSLVGTLWTTNPQADRLFWSAFYHAIWARKPLGEAVQAARQLVRQALPDSMDWLAYFAVGDPMARGYVPRLGEGYASLDCLSHNLEQPLRVGETYNFYASLAHVPPVTYHGRRHRLEPTAVQAPRLMVFAPEFDIEPDKWVSLVQHEDHLGQNFQLRPRRSGQHDLFVKFFDGEEMLQTIDFTVEVEGGQR